ncbi:MAG: hypothetical protein ACLFVW_06245 [Phycisphaerae bacterium]
MSDSEKSREHEPPEPVDVHDGIPDRSGSPRRWPVLVMGGVFLCWLGFLIYCAAAGNP